MYMLIVKRVDKRRYKSMRGKIGRFELVLRRVSAKKRIGVGLQALSYD